MHLMRPRYLILCCLVMPLSVLAQTDQPRALEEIRADIQGLSEQIDELFLWEEMQRLGNYIPNGSRCADYYRWVREKFEELNALNDQYRGRADASYRRRADILTQEKNDAIREYQSCFASEARRSALVVDAGMTRREDFKARYDQLKSKYGEGEINRFKLPIERQIYKLQTELVEAQIWDDWEMPDDGTDFDGPMATVTAVFRDVRVRRGGREQRLVRGSHIYLGDIILTGPRGRARVELNDRIDQHSAGPTVVNIGSGSEVEIAKYSRRRVDEGVVATMWRMLRGSIRAFTQGFGGRAAFSVRVGTSLCGIRGTDLSVSYDPEQGQASYLLQHGTADLYDKGGQRNALRPGSQLAVYDGVPQFAVNLSPEDYAQKIVATSIDPDLSFEQALVEAREKFGEGSTMLVKTQPGKAEMAYIHSRFNPAEAESRLGSSAKEAHAGFERLQNAAARNDIEAMTANVSGQIGRDFRNTLAEFGADEVSRRGWRPRSWVVDCVTCDEPVRCFVFFRSENVDAANGTSRRRREAFQVEKQPGGRWLPVESFTDPTDYDDAVEHCAWR